MKFCIQSSIHSVVYFTDSIFRDRQTTHGICNTCIDSVDATKALYVWISGFVVWLDTFYVWSYVFPSFFHFSDDDESKPMLKQADKRTRAGFCFCSQGRLPGYCIQISKILYTYTYIDTQCVCTCVCVHEKPPTLLLIVQIGKGKIDFYKYWDMGEKLFSGL